MVRNFRDPGGNSPTGAMTCLVMMSCGRRLHLSRRERSICAADRVRGSGPSRERSPSPGSHLAMRSDLSLWERWTEIADTPTQATWSPLNAVQLPGIAEIEGVAI